MDAAAERKKTMDLLEIMRRRRSIRNYSGEEIPEESLTKVLQAGIL